LTSRSCRRSWPVTTGTGTPWKAWRMGDPAQGLVPLAAARIRRSVGERKKVCGADHVKKNLFVKAADPIWFSEIEASLVEIMCRNRSRQMSSEPNGKSSNLLYLTLYITSRFELAPQSFILGWRAQPYSAHVTGLFV